VAIQSDGKIVAVGHRRFKRFAVLRFLSNGALDTSFGGDGKVTTLFAKPGGASAVAIQADGKIVAAGTIGEESGQNGWFALARFLPSGSLDPSFGGGDGRGRRQFSRFFDRCNAVAIQPDGKIVVAGSRALGFTAGDMAVMRFNSDGSLDTSFDGDGKQAIDLSTDPDSRSSGEARGVVVQPDGRIVLGGAVFYGPPDFPRGFALARLNADGSLDSTFGSGGKALSPLPSSDSDPFGLALGSDGKLVLVGSIARFGFRLTLTRYNTDGSLDSSFGGDGLVKTRFPGRFESFGYDVEVQPDGRVVAVGAATPDFAVARYNVDGTLDASFDGDGRVTTSFNPRWGGPIAFGVALQPDGNIVAVGDAEGRPTRLLLARYLGS